MNKNIKYKIKFNHQSTILFDISDPITYGLKFNSSPLNFYKLSISKESTLISGFYLTSTYIFFNSWISFSGNLKSTFAFNVYESLVTTLPYTPSLTLITSFPLFLLFLSSSSFFFFYSPFI